jgi:hypothetical protein
MANGVKVRNGWKADVAQDYSRTYGASMANVNQIAWTAAALGVAFVAATWAVASNRRMPDRLLMLTTRYTQTAGCEVSVEGQSFTLPDDEARMVLTLRKLRGDRQSARVTGSAALPYRCVGHAIFVAQRAGFTKVNFTAGK